MAAALFITMAAATLTAYFFKALRVCNLCGYVCTVVFHCSKTFDSNIHHYSFVSVHTIENTKLFRTIEKPKRPSPGNLV